LLIERGSKKWTSLFLPEHLRMLREWIEEDNYTDKPDLNEIDFEAIQDDLQLAYSDQRELAIKVWKNREVYVYQGKIKEVDLRLRIIRLETQKEPIRISFDDIIGTKVID